MVKWRGGKGEGKKDRVANGGDKGGIKKRKGGGDTKRAWGWWKMCSMGRVGGSRVKARRELEGGGGANWLYQAGKAGGERQDKEKSTSAEEKSLPAC